MQLDHSRSLPWCIHEDPRYVRLQKVCPGKGLTQRSTAFPRSYMKCQLDNFADYGKNVDQSRGPSRALRGVPLSTPRGEDGIEARLRRHSLFD